MIVTERIAAAENPLLEIYDLATNGGSPVFYGRQNGYGDPYRSYSWRAVACRYFAWAVPTESVLDLVASHGPIVEIGAGTGYWAWLLRKRGVDVVAYDARPAEWNGWCEAVQWTEVRRGSAFAAALHQDRTLLLCWPPYDTPMALQALQAYRGNRLIYVGEGSGGCNANDEFFAELKRRWTVRAEDDDAIPQWPGLHDGLAIWERRS